MINLLVGALIGAAVTEVINLIKDYYKNKKRIKHEFFDLLDRWYEELGRVFDKETNPNYGNEYIQGELDLLEKKCRHTKFYIKKIERKPDLFEEINKIWHNMPRIIVDNMRPENKKTLYRKNAGRINLL